MLGVACAAGTTKTARTTAATTAACLVAPNCVGDNEALTYLTARDSGMCMSVNGYVTYTSWLGAYPVLSRFHCYTPGWYSSEFMTTSALAL